MTAVPQTMTDGPPTPCLAAVPRDWLPIPPYVEPCPVCPGDVFVDTHGRSGDRLTVLSVTWEDSRAGGRRVARVSVAWDDFGTPRTYLRTVPVEDLAAGERYVGEAEWRTQQE